MTDDDNVVPLRPKPKPLELVPPLEGPPATTDMVGAELVPPPEPDTPHLRGPAFCGACGYEWEAVIPVGQVHIDCPKCNRLWGALKHVVEPPTGSSWWTCNCGERLFFVTPSGFLCRRCGNTPKFP